jgi:hypothetical protein
MKKSFYIFIFLLGMQFTGSSQDELPAGSNIHALKVGFVTRRLALTSDEAQKFWPVYNEYVKELRKARIEEKEDVLLFEERALNIRKKYKGEFKKILTSEDRLNKALTVDRDFNNVLKKELQRRAQMRGMRKEFNKKDTQ